MSAKLLFVGDVMLSRQIKPILNDKNEDFLWCHVNDVFKGANFLCCNLETPLADKSLKEGAFKTPTAHVKHLRIFDLVNVANNHIYDCGVSGFEETIYTLKKNNINYCGIFERDHKGNPIIEPLICHINDINVAFIGVTSKRFFKNKCYKNSKYQVLFLEDKELLKKHLQKAKLYAEKVFLILHDGDEFVSFPNPHLIDKLRNFIKEGFDFVICHHPHVLSGYENYEKGLIAYSLGDFIFDSDLPKRRISAILEVNIFSSGQWNKMIHPVRINDSFQPYLLMGKERDKVLLNIKSTSNIITSKFYYYFYRIFYYYSFIAFQIIRIILLAKKEGVQNMIKFVSNRMKNIKYHIR